MEKPISAAMNPRKIRIHLVVEDTHTNTNDNNFETFR